MTIKLRPPAGVNYCVLGGQVMALILFYQGTLAANINHGPEVSGNVYLIL